MNKQIKKGIPILLNLEQELIENNQQHRNNIQTADISNNNGSSEQYNMQEVGKIIAKIESHLEVNANADEELYRKKTEKYDEAVIAIDLYISSQEALQSNKQKFNLFSILRNKLNPIDIHLLAQYDWHSNLIPSAIGQINK